jgi:chaperonin GroEL
LRSPTEQIVNNAGADGPVVVAEVLEKGRNIGYDAAKGEYVDMVAAGIIDPTKVSRIALQNAASVAGLLLTTDLMVTDLDEKEQEIQGAVR